MTKRDETIEAIWRGIDPSAEGAFRIAADQAAAAVRAMPFGTFADEVPENPDLITSRDTSKCDSVVVEFMSPDGYKLASDIYPPDSVARNPLYVTATHIMTSEAALRHAEFVYRKRGLGK